jgi:hypothetical protein
MHEPVTKRRPMIDMEEFERRLRQSSGNQTDADPLAELARLIGRQRDLVRRAAQPQGQSSTEARQVATPSPEAQETKAQEPGVLQSLDDNKLACQDSGAVNEKIASRRSLYIMIMAAIIFVGVVGVGASLRFRSGASLPPEIATISDDGPAKPQFEKTNRSDLPTPAAPLPGAAPQPSPVTAVNNIAQPVDPHPRETMPAAEIPPSPEQIEKQVEPSKETAPIEPEKMNTASVERQDALMPSDLPPRAIAKIVPLPVPRPAAMAKAPKPAARLAMPKSGVGAKFQRGHSVAIANTAKPKHPASTVTAQPVQATDSQGGGREPDPLGDLLRGLFGNAREP